MILEQEQMLGGISFVNEVEWNEVFTKKLLLKYEATYCPGFYNNYITLVIWTGQWH